MTLVDTPAGPLVLDLKTAEFVRSLGHLILTKVDPAAARLLKLRGEPHDKNDAGSADYRGPCSGSRALGARLHGA
jgi:hypothetical protein